MNNFIEGGRCPQATAEIAMRPALPTSFLVLSLLFGGVAALSACGQDATSPDPPQDAPGESVEAQTPPEVEELLASLASARATDAAGLLSEHALEHVDAPSGAPSEAANYDLIQGSALALSQAEEQSLAEHGFVIS